MLVRPGLPYQYFGRLRWADCLSSGAQDQPGQHGKILSYPKKIQISKMWQHTPVVTATWEAEVRGRGSSEPLFSRLGNRVRCCLKKRKKLSEHMVYDYLYKLKLTAI